MQRTVHLLFSGGSRVVADLEMRNRGACALVYPILPVTVQQKTSSIAGMEICSNRESNICSSLFLFQDVLDRLNRHGENVGYRLATNVRDIIYYETAKDLRCTGAGN